MAIYFQKQSTMSLYLAAREQMLAPFDFGSDWTELRCGAFVSGCNANDLTLNAADDHAGFMNEDLDNAIYFGIKNSDSQSIPGQTGSVYLGIKPTGGTPFDSYSKWNAFSVSIPPVSVTTICDALGRVSACGYDGTDLVDGGIIASQSGSGAIKFKNYSESQGYCGLYVIRFVILDRGGPSQSVRISISSRSEVFGTDLSPFALQQEMNNAVFGVPKTISWNLGGSPRAIPDAFFIRLPFFANRLMIAAMRAIRYQP